MAVHRRLLFTSIGVAVAVSLLGGYALSRSGDDTAADDEVDLGSPTVVQEPGIATNAVVEGTPLPDVTLQTNDGDDITTTGLLGQPLIINYWYSTCAPCKQELPEFATVHAELGDDVRFVGVNPFDTPETNESFARDRGVQYELLRDVDGAFGAEVGIVTAPVTLFITADGTIVRQTGVLNADDLRRYAQELLG